MSALSASTSSCGGDGGLFGLEGDSLGGGATSFVAFFALLKRGKRGGASFWISLSECSDSPLLSESESAMLVVAGNHESGRGLQVENIKRRGSKHGLSRQQGRSSGATKESGLPFNIYVPLRLQ